MLAFIFIVEAKPDGQVRSCNDRGNADSRGFNADSRGFLFFVPQEPSTVGADPRVRPDDRTRDHPRIYTKTATVGADPRVRPEDRNVTASVTTRMDASART